MKMKIPVVVLVIVMLAFAPSRARAAWFNLPAGANGLAGNEVQSISEDSTGAVWFASDRGVSRFDGFHWSTLRDSLSPPVVKAVLPARDGSIWLATEQHGVLRYAAGRWTRFTHEGGELASNSTWAVLEDHAGDVWIGTSQGLARYRPTANAWSSYGTVDGLIHPQAWRLAEDAAGTLWIASPEGLSRLDPTRTQFDRLATLPGGAGPDSILALAPDPAGAMWIGTSRGAFRASGGTWRRWTRADGLASDSVVAVAADGRGGAWFGTDAAGISHYDGVSTWRSQRVTSPGQPIARVLAIHLDARGMLWVGSQSAGLLGFDGEDWAASASPDARVATCPEITTPDARTFRDLAVNDVASLFEDRDARVWIFLRDADGLVLDAHGARVALRDVANLPAGFHPVGAFEDRSGRLWFASDGQGLARWDPADGSGTVVSGPVDAAVRAIGQTRDGDLWVSTAGGLSRLHGGEWSQLLVGDEVLETVEDSTGVLWARCALGLRRIHADRLGADTLTTADGLPGDQVRAILAGRSGTWFATDRGLAHVVNGAIVRDDGAFPGAGVLGLREARDGAVWAFAANGAARLGSGSWTTYPVAAGSIPRNPTGASLEASDGAIWIGCQTGRVARFDGMRWKGFDSTDGVITTPTTMLAAREGELFFGGGCGLTSFSERCLPRTVLTAIPDTLTTRATFDFAVSSLLARGDEDYRMELDGVVVRDWSPVATYGAIDLPQGHHEFVASTRDGFGRVDPHPARWDFEVDALPPTALLESPSFGDAVRDTVVFVGTAEDPRFRSWSLAVKAHEQAWGTDTVFAVGPSTTPRHSVVLGAWNTRATGSPDGLYDARLSIVDTLGLVGVTEVRFQLDNQAPFHDVTTPVLVSADDGAEVNSILGDVRLRIPPHALDGDATVTIVPELPVGPLPPGSVVAGPVDTIAIRPGRLDRPAALRMRALVDGAAIWRRGGDGTWLRLGGTADPGGLGILVDAPGTYAVLTGGAPGPVAEGLSGLAFAPRVLRASGAAAAPVAIGFTLGQDADVTVHIYNRAGRSVRELRGRYAAGGNSVLWDGLDDGGRAVLDGLYVVGVEALGRRVQSTLAVVR